jgi:pSer/pThr/pTyr-binding forkhead associated (FHA) protein
VKDGSKRILSIGRDPDNDLVLAHETVSRRHAQVYLKEGLLWIRDLHSANHVYVNGQQITEGPIKATDRLTLGLSVVVSVDKLREHFNLGRGNEARLPLPGIHGVDKSTHKLRIGRAADNDVVISDDRVSAYHVILELGAFGWQWRDAGSTNGTYVNHERLAGPVPLVVGEEVRLGSFPFEYMTEAQIVAALHGTLAAGSGKVDMKTGTGTELAGDTDEACPCIPSHGGETALAAVTPPGGPAMMKRGPGCVVTCLWIVCIIMLATIVAMTVMVLFFKSSFDTVMGFLHDLMTITG